MTFYKSSEDETVEGMSYLPIVIVILGLTPLIITNGWLYIICIATIIGIIVLFKRNVPIGYLLKNHTLYIKTNSSEKLIGEIKSFQLLAPDKIKKIEREWGNGGFFCYSGQYSIGCKKFTVYSRNFKNPIWVSIKGENYLLSPDDIDNFVKELGASSTNPTEK